MPKWIFNFVPSLVRPVVKNPPASAGDMRYMGSIPGFGRSLEMGSDNPLQDSCLGDPMDRGARWVQSIGLQRVGQNGASEHKHKHGSFFTQ